MAALTRRGVVVLREGKAHTIVGMPNGPATSLPRHRELDRRTVQAIAGQLGIDRAGFLKEVR